MNNKNRSAFFVYFFCLISVAGSLAAMDSTVEIEVESDGFSNMRVSERAYQSLDAAKARLKGAYRGVKLFFGSSEGSIEGNSVDYLAVSEQKEQSQNDENREKTAIELACTDECKDALEESELLNPHVPLGAEGAQVGTEIISSSWHKVIGGFSFVGLVAIIGYFFRSNVDDATKDSL